MQAAEVALAGVREEAKVGQRTTLDVLNAQQTLLQARVQLVNAQHDQVVDSYTLLSAIGRLSVKMLGLSVAEYNPRTHFDLVKAKQFGVRTPRRTLTGTLRRRRERRILKRLTGFESDALSGHLAIGALRRKP